MCADGTFGPCFIIIRHTAKAKWRPDQTSMQVLKKLHKILGDEWEFCVWTRKLKIKNKQGVLFTATYKHNYLRHKKNGHVITSQHKA